MRRAAIVLGAVVAIWAIVGALVGALVVTLDRPALAMAGEPERFVAMLTAR